MGQCLSDPSKLMLALNLRPLSFLASSPNLTTTLSPRFVPVLPLRSGSAIAGYLSMFEEFIFLVNEGHLRLLRTPQIMSALCYKSHQLFGDENGNPLFSTPLV